MILRGFSRVGLWRVYLRGSNGLGLTGGRYFVEKVGKNF